jgi:hypothetical protein
MTSIALDDVKRLKVSEGDVLVLSVPENAPTHVLESVSATLRETFPMTPCMILAAPSFDLGVAEGAVESYRAELDAAFDRIVEGMVAERVANAIAAGLASYGRIDPAAVRAAHAAARKAFLDE